jgi:hypothetical protein
VIRAELTPASTYRSLLLIPSHTPTRRGNVFTPSIVLKASAARSFKASFRPFFLLSSFSLDRTKKECHMRLLLEVELSPVWFSTIPSRKSTHLFEDICRKHPQSPVKYSRKVSAIYLSSLGHGQHAISLVLNLLALSTQMRTTKSARRMNIN